MKEGVCPKCGEDLEYGIGELQDSNYIQSVNCPECGWEGVEVSKLVFVDQEEA